MFDVAQWCGWSLFVVEVIRFDGGSDRFGSRDDYGVDMAGLVVKKLGFGYQ